MHHRAIDLTGEQFGSLTIVRYAGSNGKKSLWWVMCVCGVTKKLVASELRQGRVKSCGCQMREFVRQSRTTHGMSHHPAFAVWRSMLDRCKLPTHQAWKNYGGRGIQVCRRWQKSFENFWTDMGATYQRGLTLDRIENDGHYRKSNCRWTTYAVQANNRRKAA